MSISVVPFKVFWEGLLDVSIDRKFCGCTSAS